MLKDRIKQERVKKDISQRILAQNIGVSQQTIASWETGRTEPDQNSIKKLCEFFNITSNSLLGIDTTANNRTSTQVPSSLDTCITDDELLEYVKQHFETLSDEESTAFFKKISDLYFNSKQNVINIQKKNFSSRNKKND